MKYHFLEYFWLELNSVITQLHMLRKRIKLYINWNKNKNKTKNEQKHNTEINRIQATSFNLFAALIKLTWYVKSNVFPPAVSYKNKKIKMYNNAIPCQQIASTRKCLESVEFGSWANSLFIETVIHGDLFHTRSSD